MRGCGEKSGRGGQCSGTQRRTAYDIYLARSQPLPLFAVKLRQSCGLRESRSRVCCAVLCVLRDAARGRERGRGSEPTVRSCSTCARALIGGWCAGARRPGKPQPTSSRVSPGLYCCAGRGFSDHGYRHGVCPRKQPVPVQKATMCAGADRHVHHFTGASARANGVCRRRRATAAAVSQRVLASNASTSFRDGAGFCRSARAVHG